MNEIEVVAVAAGVVIGWMFGEWIDSNDRS